MPSDAHRAKCFMPDIHSAMRGGMTPRLHSSTNRKNTCRPEIMDWTYKADIVKRAGDSSPAMRGESARVAPSQAWRELLTRGADPCCKTCILARESGFRAFSVLPIAVANMFDNISASFVTIPS